MECDICKCNVILPGQESRTINSRNFAVEKDGKYICNACNESIMFLVDISEVKKDDSVKIKKKEKEKCEVKKDIKPKYICIKCKNSYEGHICNKCNTPNPLFRRKKNNQKKRNKSKKK
tara:strand:+ start:284 stop:637 length:354 start_codon:yes stop_codon:yes gene_type:complete